MRHANRAVGTTNGRSARTPADPPVSFDGFDRSDSPDRARGERADTTGARALNGSTDERVSWRLRLAGIGGLAFALRALYVWQAWPHPAIQLPVIDAAAYRDRALEILAGDWLGTAVYYLDPLYPFFLAAVYAFVPPDSAGVLLAQAALDSVSAVLIALLSRRIGGERAGLVAGLLAASYAPFLYYAALLLKAPLMIFLVVSALLLVLRASAQANALPWLPAGGLLGLAALTRGNSLLFAPVLGLWILFLGDGDRRARVLAVAALGAGLALAIGPVTLRNWLVGDDLVLLNSQAGQNFYIGHFSGNETGAYVAPPFLRPNPVFEEEDFAQEARRRSGRDDLAPSEISAFWLREGLAEIAEDPLRFLRHSARKALLLLNRYEIPDNASFEYFAREVAPMLRGPLPGFGFVLCLAGAGVVVAGRRREAVLLLLYFLAYAAGILLFFNLSRLRLPLVPVLIAFAACGLVAGYEAVRGRRWREFALPAAVALALVPITRLDLVRQDLNVRYVNMGVGFLDVSEDRFEEAEALRAEGQAADAAARYAAAFAARARAEEQFERALEETPGYARAERALRRSLFGKAVLYDHLDRPQDALAAARAAVERFGDDAPSWAMVGRSLERLGRPEAARRAYGQALRLDPAEPAARAGLRRLATAGRKTQRAPGTP